jgi:alginate O-acetyltransferase complex protein AlgI
LPLYQGEPFRVCMLKRLATNADLIANVMSFASVVFFLFLPLVFAIHWLVQGRRWQNGVLLVASYIFYGWWDWRFCFLMIGSSLIDYWAGLRIDQEPEQRKRKEVLIVALSSNLLILGFFKYFNFFSESLLAALSAAGVHMPEWSFNIILPVGISFYTFQTMSYTLDIYFGRFKPLRSAVDYLSFVSFFPQLVAGPIERATALLPQFHAVRVFSSDDAREGCRFILWGLAKKMIVADNLALIVNNAYKLPGEATGAELLLATIAFSFQIYCDFSAYSDIAVGTARFFGIHLTRNFAYPYFSQSITEFWRRWHISLSTWFRDYIYVPLGGNRCSNLMNYRNLLVVTLLSGLWHGAAWTYVMWGAVHGVYLIGERLLARSRSIPVREAVPGGLGVLPAPAVLLRMTGTFMLVSFAWIFFRAESMPDAIKIIGKIASATLQITFYREIANLLQRNQFTWIILLLFIMVEWFNRGSWNAFSLKARPVLVRWVAYSMLFWAILLFGTHQAEEFIYFRF